MRVWLDPEKSRRARTERRWTSCAAIQEQNAQVAAGIGGPAAAGSSPPI